MWIIVLFYALILSGRISRLQAEVRELQNFIEQDDDVEVEYVNPTDWLSIIGWLCLIGTAVFFGLTFLEIV